MCAITCRLQFISIISICCPTSYTYWSRLEIVSFRIFSQKVKVTLIVRKGISNFAETLLLRCTFVCLTIQDLILYTVKHVLINHTWKGVNVAVSKMRWLQIYRSRNMAYEKTKSSTAYGRWLLNERDCLMNLAAKWCWLLNEDGCIIKVAA